MSDTIVGTSYIVKTLGVVGGRPRIVGHRIAVDFVVDLFVRQSITVEEIAAHFSLKPAEIYAALSYYYDHQQEIDDILLDQDAYEEAAKTLAPDGRLDREKQSQLPDLARRIKAGWEVELTVTEIAQTYGISTAAVREAAAKGRVPARKSGATWLIRRSDAEGRWGDRARRAG
jgi:excisionase family DNA binding protein